MPFWTPLLLLILLPISTSLAAAEHVDSPPLLRVGGDAAYPPYEFLDERGRPAGFHVELLAALAREVGQPVEHRLGPWPGQKAALEAGELDLLPMFASAEHRARFLFLPAHAIVHYEIYVRRADAATGFRPGRPEDLAGRRVLVQGDALAATALPGLQPDIGLLTVASEPEALRRLAAGDGDAAVVTSPVGRRFLAGPMGAALLVLGAPLLPVEYAIAVRPDRPDLHQRLSQALQQVQVRGELQALQQRWLEPPPPASSAPLVLLGGGLTLLLLFAGWLLRRLLQRRRRSDTPGNLADREALRQALQCAARNAGGNGNGFALLLLDIDQLRRLNAAAGQAAGDRMLAIVAAAVRALVQPGALCARLGGDEFALLLPDLSPKAALRQAESLRRCVATIEIEGAVRPLRCTASIGLIHASSLPQRDFDSMIDAAEQALALAKELGRDRVVVYDPEDRRQRESAGLLHLAEGLREAIEDQRLCLWIQPILPLQSDAGSAPMAEILLRVISEDGHVLAPGPYIEAAERFRSIRRLDRWVIDQVLSALQQQRARFDGLACLLVNLSAASLADPEFRDWLLDRLDGAAVSLPRLGIELTESALMANTEALLPTLQALRERGLRLALDDFGVGQSSLARLRDLPIDFLKIDGSFCSVVDRGESQRALVVEMTRLSSLLGKQTIAEHVETEAIARVLTELGVAWGQGYGLQPPMPLSQWQATQSVAAEPPP